MTDPETPTVERFVPMGTPDRDDVEMTTHAQGQWVRYADYLTLHAQLTALQDAVKEWRDAEDAFLAAMQVDTGRGEDDWPSDELVAVDAVHTAARAKLRALVDPPQQKET